MPVTSSTSSIKRWPSSEIVLSALKNWSAVAAEDRDDLIALGYFGSYARGDAGFASDLDLIAIVLRDDRPAMDRPGDWNTGTLPVPADLLVYTAEEWEGLQAEGGRFSRTLNAEAQWVVKRNLP